MPSKKLSQLLQQTEENITTNKDLRFTYNKSIADSLKPAYYEKYMAKSVDEYVRKEKAIVKNKQGKNEEVEETFVKMPMHNKNILLAMAFYKAHEFYTTLRKKIKANGENTKPVDIEININEDIENDVADLSAAECLVLSRQLNQGKNRDLIKNIKKRNLEQLNAFQKIEEINVKVLEELRNYHAHIFHEPSPIHFENFYGDDFKVKKKLSSAEWKTARNYFATMFADKKNHLVEKTLTLQIENNKNDSKALGEINKVKSRIEGYSFEENGIITQDALLFIACYFLRKSDANFFIKKWTGMKKAEGVFKTSQTFFNSHALKDSKSLFTASADMFKFRQIVGLLSAMPLLKNDCFKPFYELIKKNNDFYGEQVECERDKTKKEKLQENLIPIRKNNNYTTWYMGYLKEKGLLSDVEVAYYKMPEDRISYIKAGTDNDDMEALKLKMKLAKDEEKRKLTAIYKEAKLNFVFKPNTTLDDNFCTKKENAIIRYIFTDVDTNQKVSVQVNLSPSLLLKWVFADIYLSKGEEVKQTILKFCRSYYKALSLGNIPDTIMGLPASKIFPASLLYTIDDNIEVVITIEQSKRILQSKLNSLQKFIDENNAKKAPWKFAAKQKIDIIFAYIHTKYSSTAFDSHKTEPVKRHEALNDMEYLDALEFIRFYGKNQQLPEFIDFFKHKKNEYFKPIIKYLDDVNCNSLEKLFNNVVNDYLGLLTMISGKLSNTNLQKVIKVFKIDVQSLKSNIKKHASLFAVNQSISPDLISLKKLMKDNEEFKNWGSSQKYSDPNRYSDFSLIRSCLSKNSPYTNADYMLKCVMPALNERKELQLTKEGKLKGNTSFFNGLMTCKTEELIMWEIANYYWTKANGNRNNANENIILKRNEVKPMLLPLGYKRINLYQKLYKNNINVKLNSHKTEATYQVEIMPNKFDDEFQHFKHQNLIDYIEQCMSEEERKKQPFSFKELNIKIQDKLVKYLDDVYLLLVVEKYITLQNMDFFKSKLQLINDKIPPIYIPFGKVNMAGQDIFENILSNKLYSELGQNLSFSNAELIQYRNNAMHQQIMSDTLQQKIKQALINYCKTNKLFEYIK